MHRQLTALLGGVLLAWSAYAGRADLSWVAPTTNTDGSALTNLTGYGVFRRCTVPNTPAGAIVQIATVAVPTVIYADLNLPDDGRTCWYSLTSVNSVGTSSVRTNEVSKTFVVAAQPPGATTHVVTWTTTPIAPPPVGPKVVQTGSLLQNSAANNQAVVTLPNNAAVGNTVVAFVWVWYPSSRYPVGWTSAGGDTGVLFDAPSGIERVWVGSLSVQHASKTFTFVLSGINQYQRIHIVEVAGTHGVDGTAVVAPSSPGTGVDALRTPPLLPTVSGDMLLGVAFNGVNQSMPNAGTGFASVFTTTNSAGDATRVESMQNVSAAGVPVTFTLTSAVAHTVSGVLLKP